MGKQIGKSAFWIGAFYVTNFIVLFILIIIEIIRGNANFILSESTSKEILEYSENLSSLMSIFSGFVILGIFLIMKLIQKRQLDIGRMEWDKPLFMGFVGFSYNFILTVLIAILVMLVSFVDPSFYEEFTNAQELQEINNVSQFLLSLLGTGIMVPIMEEIVFRYGICGTIGKENRTLGIVLSAVIFGIAHGDLFQIMYTMALGFVLAIVYTKYDNIWYPIATHMTFNSLTVFSQYLGSDAVTYIVGIVSCIGIIVLLLTRPELRTLLKLPKLPRIQKPMPVYNYGYGNQGYNYQGYGYPQNNYNNYPQQYYNQGVGYPNVYGANINQRPMYAPNMNTQNISQQPICVPNVNRLNTNQQPIQTTNVNGGFIPNNQNTFIPNVQRQNVNNQYSQPYQRIQNQPIYPPVQQSYVSQNFAPVQPPQQQINRPNYQSVYNQQQSYPPVIPPPYTQQPQNLYHSAPPQNTYQNTHSIPQNTTPYPQNQNYGGYGVNANQTQQGIRENIPQNNRPIAQGVERYVSNQMHTQSQNLNNPYRQ